MIKRGLFNALFSALFMGMVGAWLMVASISGAAWAHHGSYDEGHDAVAANETETEVFVYTARQPYLLEPVFEAFTEETGITVRASFLGNKLLARLEVEGANTPADVVITTNFHGLYALDTQNRLQAIDDPALLALVPKGLADNHHRWFALTQRARLIYAANEVADEIQSYDDLADPKWQGRVCSRPFAHGYNIALVAAYEVQHGAAATRRWLQGIKANLARKPLGNDRAQVKAIWAGVCDLAIGNSYYYWLMQDDPEQQAWAQAVTPVFPTLANGGVHVNISGMGMLTSARHPHNALKLMRYMLSRKAQAFYANVNREFPVRADVDLEPPLSAWQPMVSRLHSADMAKAAQRTREASDLVDQLGIDR